MPDARAPRVHSKATQNGPCIAKENTKLTLDTLTHSHKIRTNTQNRKYFPDLPWNMCSPAIFFVYVSANFVASP